MEQENKKEYSYEEIMAAINKMDATLAKCLMEIGFSGIEEAVNNKYDKSIGLSLMYCQHEIEAYTRLRDGIAQFCSILNGEVTEEKVIADMMEQYRKIIEDTANEECE